MGEDGLDQALNGHYEMAVVDLLLGDMTAITWLDETRAAGLDLPIVVVTGYASIETAVQAMRRGAINYMVKPLLGDELVRTIEMGLAEAAFKRHPEIWHCAHAAERWAKVVVAAIDSRSDPRTIGQWARTVGASASSLHVWCRMAGLSSRKSLTFARLLRAVHQSRSAPWRPTLRLAVCDPRTLGKMLDAGNLPPSADRVSVEQFLANQSLIQDHQALGALRQLLTDRQ